MNCPRCNGATRVVDTRKLSKAVCRIRRCTACHASFDTQETLLELVFRQKPGHPAPGNPSSA
jgi:transcriptional regulator NrdR family protein